MPSYLDLGLIVIVLISALLAMLRGFTREILAIASWGAAAAAAVYFYPAVLPYVKPYISKDVIAMATAAALVFFATLVLVSIITIKLSDVILDSKVGALDRSLGFVFGAARGVLLCVIAYIFFSWLVPPEKQPDWAKNAKMRPFLIATGDELTALLPDDPEGLIGRFKKAKPATAADEPPQETDPSKPLPTPPSRDDNTKVP
jgi:membrane protein required for colicin V production